MARNDDWQLSVRALQGMVRNGTIDTVVGRHLERDQVSGGIWPSDDVLSIENGSTWWIEDGSFFIHIPNPSVYNIRTVRFHFEPRTCASSSSHETFHVQLDAPWLLGRALLRLSVFCRGKFLLRKSELSRNRRNLGLTEVLTPAVSERAKSGLSLVHKC